MKKAKYEPVEVIEAKIEALKPYDAKAASRELSRKKRYGEADWNERLPKKRSIDQLRKEYASSTWSEIENSVRCDVDTNIFYENAQPTQIEKLIELCRSIVNLDDNYQGLWTEVEHAKRDAELILEMAKEIKVIIDNTKQEDARLTQTILKILDVPFKRVLGDRIDDLELDYMDLESWLKTQYWKNERLTNLIRREDYIQAIFKYSPR
jgi:hypothetical protein